MKLIILDDEFAVARLGPGDAVPPWADQGAISSVTRTAEELSVVCGAKAVPSEVMAERGWRCVRVAGQLDLSLTGILASILGPLAEARVSIFAIATYDTDYVLVRETSLHAAIECLTAAGHQVEHR